MLDAKIIGKRLRELRGNLSRKKVADIIGVSVSALSMYELGERIPRDEVKVKIAELYGKSVGAIFFNY